MKLTKYDFYIVDDGIMIKCEDGEETELEKQILSNQEIINDVKKLVNESTLWVSVTQLKEILKGNN